MPRMGTAERQRSTSGAVPGATAPRRAARVASSTLRYGASVSLAHVLGLGHISGRGFAMSNLHLFDPTSTSESAARSAESFSNCVFTITPQQQYSAASALAEALQDDSGSEASVGTTQYARLVESARLEAKQNDENNRERLGQEVRFGSVIQLRHANSGKFLTVRPRILAVTEKGCIKLELDATGDDNSHLMIIARYKHRNEGDRVRITDNVFLMSTTTKMYIHASVGELRARAREVNVSNQRTPWQITIYASDSDERSGAVRGGQCIRLYHWESEATLSAAMDMSHLTDELSQDSKRGLVYLQGAEASSGATGDLREYSMTGRNTNALWEVELPDPSMGSAIGWGEPFRLRHMNTGRYLAARTMSEQEAKAVEAAAEQSRKAEREALKSVLSGQGSLRSLATTGTAGRLTDGGGGGGGSTTADSPEPVGAEDVDSDVGGRSSRLSDDMLLVGSTDLTEVDDIDSDSSGDDEDTMNSMFASAAASEPTAGLAMPMDDARLPFLPDEEGQLDVRPATPVSVEVFCTMQATPATLFEFHTTEADERAGRGHVPGNGSARLRHTDTGAWIHGSRERRVDWSFVKAKRRAMFQTAEDLDDGDRSSPAIAGELVMTGVERLPALHEEDDHSDGAGERKAGGGDEPVQLDGTEAAARARLAAQDEFHATHGFDDGEESARELTFLLSGVHREDEQDAFQIVVASKGEIEETLFLLAALPSLWHYIRMVRKRAAKGKSFKPAGVVVSSALSMMHSASQRSLIEREDFRQRSMSPTDTDREKAARSMLPLPATQMVVRQAIDVLRDLILFVVGRPPGSDPFELSRAPIRRRQRLLRESNVAAMLVAVLTSPFRRWGGRLEMSPMHPMLELLCRLTYQLVLLMFKDDRKNELHVAQYLNVFIKQCGYDIGAERALTELLTNNITLLEQLPAAHVKAFVNLIKTKGKRSLYLEFLSGLCTCLDKGVPLKQELVCDLIFGNADGVYSGRDAELLGVTRPGVPGAEIVLPVRSEGSDLKVCVPVLDIGISASDSDAQDRKESMAWLTVSQIFKTKHPLRHYFLTTVELYSEMCIGRNYQAIREIEAMFSRDAVFSAMCDTSVDEAVRAAFCTLLLSLHVDRRPHDYVPVAEQTRLWNTLRQNRDSGEEKHLSGEKLRTAESDSSTHSRMPAHIPAGVTEDAEERRFFDRLWKHVLKYLQSLNGVMVALNAKSNKLTQAMLTLTLKLLQFGLVGLNNTPKVQSAELTQLCRAVMLLLDGRNDTLHESEAAVLRTQNVREKEAGSPLSKDGSRRAVDDGGVASKTKPHFVSRRGLSEGAKWAGRVDSSSRRVVDSILPAAPDPNSPIRKVATHIDIGDQRRFQQDAETLVMMRCKVIICNILRHVSQVRLDYQMTAVLKLFDTHCALFAKAAPRRSRMSPRSSASSSSDSDSGSNVSDLSDALEAIGRRMTDWNDPLAIEARKRDGVMREFRAILQDKALSLQEMCSELNVVATLLDLMMYEHEELTQGAIDLLGEHFLGFSHLSTALHGVQLIVSPSTIVAYGRLRALVPRLQVGCETSEIWLGMETAKDMGMARKMRAVLRAVCEVMWVTDKDDAAEEDTAAAALQAQHGDEFSNPAFWATRNFVDVDADRHIEYICIDRERQTLVANMGVPKLVISLLEAGSGMLQNRKQARRISSKFVHELFHIFAHCYSLLHTFCARNPRHRELLGSSQELFLHLCEQRMWSATLLGEVMKDHHMLAKELKEPFVRHIVDMVEKQSYVPSLLEPLINATNVRGVPIDANQELILRIITERLDSLLRFRIDSPRGIDALLRVMRSPTVAATLNHAFVSEVQVVSNMNKLRSVASMRTSPKKATMSMRNPSVSGRMKSTDSFYKLGVSVDEDGGPRALRQLTAELQRDPNVFFMQLLRLFQHCALGKGYRSEAKLQGLFPLESVVIVMSHASLPTSLRATFLNLFVAVWIDTQRPVKRVRSHAGLIDFFCEQLQGLYDTFAKSMPAQLRHQSDTTEATAFAISGSAGGATALKTGATRRPRITVDTDEIRQQWRDSLAVEVKYLFDSLLPALRTYVATHCDSQHVDASTTRLARSAACGLGQWARENKHAMFLDATEGRELLRTVAMLRNLASVAQDYPDDVLVVEAAGQHAVDENKDASGVYAKSTLDAYNLKKRRGSKVAIPAPPSPATPSRLPGAARTSPRLRIGAAPSPAAGSASHRSAATFGGSAARSARDVVKAFAQFLTEVDESDILRRLANKEMKDMVRAVVDVERIVAQGLEFAADGHTSDAGAADKHDANGGNVAASPTGVRRSTGQPTPRRATLQPDSAGVGGVKMSPGSQLHLRRATSGVVNGVNVVSRKPVIFFELLMRRLISYARSVGQSSDPTQLIMVLQIIRDTILLPKKPEKQRRIQCTMQYLGAVEMIYEQMCVARRDNVVYGELVETGITLLQGGNRIVQEAFLQLMKQNQAPMMDIVRRLRRAARDLRESEASARATSFKSSSQREKSVKSIPDDGSTEAQARSYHERKQRAAHGVERFRSVRTLLRLVQVLVEGHNLAMQNYLRDQGGSARAVNVVAATVAFLQELADRVTSRTTRLAIQTVDTLIDLIQGPCEMNQLELVQNKFVEVVGGLLTSASASTWLDRILHFKCMLAMTSLFEGRMDGMIHSRVASLLPFAVMKENMRQTYQDFEKKLGGYYSDAAFLLDDFLDDDDIARMPKDSVVLDTGFAVFQLFKHLLDHESTAATYSSLMLPTSADFGEQHSYGAAFRFFDRFTARVEIVRAGHLEKFYFTIPPMCTHLTVFTMEKFKWDVVRESPNTKIQGLYEAHHDMVEEMKHQQKLKFKLRTHSATAFVASRPQLWRDISFALAIIVNVIVLVCFESGDSIGAEPEPVGGVCTDKILGRSTGVNWNDVSTVIGGVQVFTAFVSVLIYYVNFGHLVVKKQLRQETKLHIVEDVSGQPPHMAKAAAPSTSFTSPESHSIVGSDEIELLSPEDFTDMDDEDESAFESVASRLWNSVVTAVRVVYFLSRDGPFSYFVLYWIMVVLGVFYHQFFFAFNLMDVVVRFKELQIVLRSVTKPIRALMLTFLLFLVVEYYFAIFGFAFMRDQYAGGDSCIDASCNNQCESLFVCFWTTFDRGFKADGGLGGYFSENLHYVTADTNSLWGWRLLFDNAFNILLLTVLMNIVFGIIIDTFAELRDLKAQIEDDSASRALDTLLPFLA